MAITNDKENSSLNESSNSSSSLAKDSYQNKTKDEEVLSNLFIEDEPSSNPSPRSLDQSQISSSSAIGMNNNAVGMSDEESVVQIELIQCDCCKRSFAPKVYEKHFDLDGQPKCASQTKKRTVFNSAKVRI